MREIAGIGGLVLGVGLCGVGLWAPNLAAVTAGLLIAVAAVYVLDGKGRGD